ncbi:unnamed protein product [Mytilus coruscus]|uniref:Death domain-containing protein n=1 Tax=Mytilus coruscus TaxID=42192 RepID=A0A6J8BJQ1_MYTCO|nr:unnamed protein product [Mytilus coruscus]
MKENNDFARKLNFDRQRIFKVKSDRYSSTSIVYAVQRRRNERVGNSSWNGVEEPGRLNFETLRRCLDYSCITLNDIRKAVDRGNIQNPHTLCRVVGGKPKNFDHEPEKWDLEPTKEHFDRLTPLVGNNSLALLVELGMDFQTWEHMRYRQMQRDLAKLNLDILQEWKTTFCTKHNIRPFLRHIGQAFKNIGKDIRIIENVLAAFF